MLEKLILFSSHLKVLEATSMRSHVHRQKILFIHSKFHNVWNCLQMGFTNFRETIIMHKYVKMPLKNFKGIDEMCFF